MIIGAIDRRGRSRLACIGQWAAAWSARAMTERVVRIAFPDYENATLDWEPTILPH
jgi:hypothetical protein